MNRIIFFLASAIAALTFASEASALPLFARQTGMECSACHFQHFPMLNSFGRAFKSGAYTMMGAEGKVEGERLSIPNVLNMNVLTTAGYAKSNGANVGAPIGANTINKGSVYVPGTNGEFSLFMGGRVSENAGFLAEIGSIGATALSSAKMPVLFEVADGTRAGVVFFTTGGQGASYGFETLNTGANAVHQMSGTPGFDSSHTNSISAQQYIGTGTAATGAAIVVNNSMGFINVTKFHMAGPADLGGTGAPLGSTYLRVAGTVDVGDWELGAGAQNWSGQSSALTAGTVPVLPNIGTHASAVDFQLQGAAGAMPVGVYLTWAVAPVITTTGVAANVYNGGSLTKSAVNLAGEVGVIPGVATLGMAVRSGKSGVADAALANETDNAVSFIGTYKLAQNMLASLSYTKQSGSFWNSTTGGSATTGGIGAAAGATGNTTYTINLFTLF